MKYVWEDLPERKNLFTVKNTAMVNLNTGETVRQYCTNTKIAVVQKCVTPEKTYYRTEDAFRNNLNYAFEAEAFGLNNEKAPLEPVKILSLDKDVNNSDSAVNTQKPVGKQTENEKTSLPKSGGVAKLVSKVRKLFRRENG